MEKEEHLYEINLFEKIEYKENIIYVITLIILTIIGNVSYTMFHSLIELMIIIMGFSIVIISKNTYKIAKNDLFLFLGIVLGFISILELIHFLSTVEPYSNQINILNLSIELDICRRYLVSLSILYIFTHLDKKINIKKISAIYFTFLSIFILDIFKFKIVSTYLMQGTKYILFRGMIDLTMVALFLIAYINLLKNKKYFNKSGIKILSIFILASLGSELLLTTNTKVYLITEIARHILLFISFYMIYRLTVVNTVKKPFRLLFNEVDRKNKQLEKEALILEEMIGKLNEKNQKIELVRDEIARGRELYKNIIDFLPIAIIARKDEKIEVVNKATLDIFKVQNESEILGRNFLDFIPEQDREVVKNRIEENHRGNKVPFIQEKILTFQGDTLDVEVASLPIETDKGIYGLVVVKDLSKEKIMAQMKVELMQNEENERLRTEFFANLSHEFRTPVNVIYSAVQLMDVNIKKQDIENLKKYNKVVKQNCYRLLRLINNLIDATKMDAGYYQLKLYRCDIIETIENVVISISEYVKKQGMNIVFDTDIEERESICDIEAIERIILNLISNSIKYRREIDGNIYVNIYDKEDGIDIVVKDDGIGILKEKQKGIFERFVQADRSLARVSEGSGIGLSIVKSLVEMHHGNINLVSELGEGTKITIYMPTNYFKTPDIVEKEIETGNVLEKVNIEFSDIYS